MHVIATLRRYAEITQPDLAAASAGNTGELPFQEVYIRGEVDVVGSGNLGSIGMVALKRQDSDICWYCSKKGRNCYLKEGASAVKMKQRPELFPIF